MPRNPTTRDRLLESTQQVVYREGVHRAGVDLLAEQAGVSKPTIYNLFGSKEQLVEQSLQQLIDQRVAQLEAIMAAESTPLAKLRALLDQHVVGPDTVFLRGCPLVAASIDAPEMDEVRAMACTFKSWVRERMASLAKAAKLRRPKQLAWRLFLTVEGGAVMSALYGGAEVGPHVRATCEELLRAAQPVRE